MKYLLFAVCLVVVGLIPSAHAEDAVFDFILQGPYTLQSGDSKAVVHIPVRTANDLKIEKLTASFRSQDPLLVSRAFTASIEPEGGRTHPQLKLTLTQDAIPGGKWHGTYHLVLDISYPEEKVRQDQNGSKTKVMIRKQRSIPLDVVYPETQVLAPQPLLVRDTWLLWGHWKTEASPLFMEVQEGPILRELSVCQVGAAKFGNDPVAGQLKLGDPEYVGQIARVPVGIQEGFPLGDVSGTIRMASPGMESKNAAFTVRTRQHRVLIIIAAAIGLFIGFLLRTGSESWIEHRRNKVQFQRLLLRVREAKGLGTDAELDGTLTELEQKVEEAIRELKTTRTESLPAKLNKLQEQLKEARTAFTNKRNTLAQSVSYREALLQAAWHVPPTARPEGDLSAVRADLVERDLETATAELTKFDTNLKKKVTKALESWREMVEMHFQDLGIVGYPLPESVQMILDSELLTNKKDAKVESTDDLMVLKSELEQADEDYQRVVDFVKSLRKQIYQVAGRVRVLLRDKAKEETLRDLEKVRKELTGAECRAKLAQAVNEPETGFTEMALCFKPVIEAMWSAIEETHKGALPADAKALLEAGKYEEAAAHAPVPGLLGGTPTRMPAPLPESRSALQPAPSIQGAPVQLHSLRAIEPLEAQIKKAWREIAAGKAIQSIGAGLGLALIAYLIFADSFIGTLADFIKVFFWGFTTDIGVNVLLEKASSTTSK